MQTSRLSTYKALDKRQKIQTQADAATKLTNELSFHWVLLIYNWTITGAMIHIIKLKVSSGHKYCFNK